MSKSIDANLVSEAFFNICKEAEPAGRHFVSLYVTVPFYGGPEEGGWWGQDVELVATQLCPTEDQAIAKQAAIEQLVKKMSDEEQQVYGDYCLRTMEWLDARGLEADFLPEPDGPTSYFVVVEDVPGSEEYRDDRYYS